MTTCKCKIDGHYLRKHHRVEHAKLRTDRRRWKMTNNQILRTPKWTCPVHGSDANRRRVISGTFSVIKVDREEMDVVGIITDLEGSIEDRNDYRMK